MTQYSEIINDYIVKYPVFTRQDLQIEIMQVEPRVKSWHHALTIVNSYFIKNKETFKIVGTAANRWTHGQRWVYLYQVVS